MPDEDRVSDSELLYRRVPDRPGDFYIPISGGGYRATSGAFGDRRSAKKKQPSVDRAILRDNNPANAQCRPTDSVVSFTAGEVRRITGFGRTIDVVPSPIKDAPPEPDNPAHALIVAEPPFTANNKEFKRFRQALAGIADSRWEIPPPAPV